MWNKAGSFGLQIFVISVSAYSQSVSDTPESIKKMKNLKAKSFLVNPEPLTVGDLLCLCSSFAACRFDVYLDGHFVMECFLIFSSS